MGIKMKEYTLENEFIKLKFLDYGAIITSLFFKNQNIETILSYDDFEDYKDNSMLMGSSLVGPYAGRIENAKYTINSEEILLDKNFKNHSIHGGYNRFNNQYFEVDVKESVATLTLKYDTLDVKIVFTLNDAVFTQEVFATTSKSTLFNPTNHLYFNLNSNDCLNYVLNLNSDYMYYLNEDSIPRQKHLTSSTSFDVLNGKGTIGEITNKQFEFTKYIDHPFKLKSNHITLFNPENNLELNIITNKPYAVVYTANFVGDFKNRISNRTAIDYMGICIETQNVPNGVNIPEEESSIIHPGEEYYYTNKYYLASHS